MGVEQEIREGLQFRTHKILPLPQIDLSGLDRGIYFLYVEAGSKTDVFRVLLN